MADYKLTNSNAVIRTIDNAYISNDTLNSDWREYQTWLTTGNLPDPADPIPDPVIIITPRQARLILFKVGLLDQVETLINQIGGSTKITWEYATEYLS